MKLRQNKDVRIFVFTLFNAAIGLIASQIAKLDPVESASLVMIATPMLNVITKYINKRFFGDL